MRLSSLVSISALFLMNGKEVGVFLELLKITFSMVCVLYVALIQILYQ